MSEMNANPDFQVPATQDFNTESFAGSMQQVLQDNIGKYVIVEFFMGTSVFQQKEGYLYDVAAQYIVIFNDINLQYVVCDVFSIKFVTFLLPNYRPGQVPALLEALENARQNVPAENTASSSGVTPSQAAFSYALRNSRR